MGVFNLKFSKVPSEKLLDVKVELIEVLQKIDEYSGGKLWIHRLHSSGNPTSQHYHGRAADGHIEGLSVIDQYVLLERFNPGGLGLYGPDIWTSPGFSTPYACWRPSSPLETCSVS